MTEVQKRVLEEIDTCGRITYDGRKLRTLRILKEKGLIAFTYTYSRGYCKCDAWSLKSSEEKETLIDTEFELEGVLSKVAVDHMKEKGIDTLEKVLDEKVCSLLIGRIISIQQRIDIVENVMNRQKELTSKTLKDLGITHDCHGYVVYSGTYEKISVACDIYNDIHAHRKYNVHNYDESEIEENYKLLDTVYLQFDNLIEYIKY